MKLINNPCKVFFSTDGHTEKKGKATFYALCGAPTSVARVNLEGAQNLHRQHQG